MAKNFCILYCLLYIFLILSDIFSISDFNISVEENGFNEFYRPGFLIIFESLLIHFIFLFFFLVTIYFFVKTNRDKLISKRKEFIRDDLSKNILLKGFIFIIILISITKLNSIFSIGFLNYLYQVRSGESTIGGLTYIVLLSFPILLLYKMPSFLKFNILTLMVVINLLSGFRLILIWSFLIIIFYNWSNNKAIIKKSKIFILIFISILFFSVGVIRELYQFDNSSTEIGNFISKVVLSTNRSSPITYLSYIISNDIGFDFIGLFKILISPILAFIDFIIDIGYIPQESFEIKIFSEKIFRGFLNYRGTGTYDATGFSIHFIPFFYSFGGVYIIPFIGIITGFLFYHSVRLMNSINSFKKNNGVFLMVFLFSSFESFSVAWGLYLYTLIIFLFLRSFKIIFSNVITNQLNSFKRFI